MAKILAIDDTQDNLITLSILLKDLIPECTVITAQSGREGIEKARSELPDTILLDIRMSGMDGFEVCERLKSEEKTKTIPVVMITAAKTDSESRIKALNLGADAFLVRPIEEEELAAQVKTMLRIKESEDLLRKEKDLLEETVEKRTAELVKVNQQLKDEIEERKRTEKAFRDSELWLNSIFDSLEEAVLVLTPDRQLVKMNEAGQRMFGYSGEELTDNSVEIFHVDHDHFVEFGSRIQEAFDTGKAAKFEFEIKRRDGEISPTEHTATQMKGEHGEPIGIVSIVRDITDKKIAEKALCESEERFRHAFENANTGVCLVSTDGCFIKVNARLCEIFGYNKEELEGMPVNDITHPEDLGLSPDFFLRSISGEMENIVYEKRFIHNKGHLVWGLISSSIVRDSEGGPIYFISHVQDITQHKFAEEALKKSEEKFSKLFQASPAYISLAALVEGRFIAVNDAFEKITGYEQSEVIGRTVYDLGLWAEPDARDQLVRLIKEKSQLRSHKITMIRKDGKLIEGLWSIERIEIDGEDCIISVFDDRTQLLKIQEELRQSEEKFSKLFHANPVYTVFTTLEDGRFLEVNDAFVKITGFQREEVIGRTTTEIGLWANPEERVKLVKLAKEKDRFRDQRVEFLKKNGEPLVMLWSAERAEIGGKDCFISALADITDIEKAQTALRESEERFTLFMDHFPGVAFMKDLKGRLVYANKAYRGRWGYKKREDWYGKTDDQLWPPETAASFNKGDQEVLSKGRSMEFIEPIPHPDGQIHTQMTTKFLVLKDHEPAYLGGIGLDITDLKRTEAALRESEERYRLLVENQNDLVVKVDKEMRLLYVSPKYCETYGKTEEELIEKNFMPLVHEEDRPRITKSLERLHHPPYTAQHEERNLTKDGWRWFNWVANGLLDEEGQLEAFVSVGRDITDRKQAEEEKQELEAQLQRAQKMEAMGLMAGGVAHDLNNILSGIVSYPDLLLMRLPEDSPLRKPIKTMQESGMKAADVVSDLLTIARGAAIAKKALNLNTIVQEYLSSAEHEKLGAIRPSVTFKTELDSELPNMTGSLPMSIRL